MYTLIKCDLHNTVRYYVRTYVVLFIAKRGMRHRKKNIFYYIYSTFMILPVPLRYRYCTVLYRYQNQVRYRTRFYRNLLSHCITEKFNIRLVQSKGSPNSNWPDWSYWHSRLPDTFSFPMMCRTLPKCKI